jgi:hypothetical protein
VGQYWENQKVLIVLCLNYTTEFGIVKYLHGFRSRAHLDDLGVAGETKCIFKE